MVDHEELQLAARDQSPWWATFDDVRTVEIRAGTVVDVPFSSRRSHPELRRAT
jgi:hypothetical protein